MLVRKVQQYGNSFGVIIPSAILEMLDIEKGDNLKLETFRKKIILEKVEEAVDEKTKQKKGRGRK
jgi:antitoxin component of MazEF toxin-antitoxin module